MTTVPAQTPPLRHLHIIHAAPTDNLTAAQQNEARDAWTLLGKYANSHPALFVDLAFEMVQMLDARIKGGAA